jgi:hypothetical protein
MIFDKGVALHRTELFTRKLYNRRIEQNSDAVVPVVGSEGVGKSTFILQLMVLWRAVSTGSEWGDVDRDTLFDRIHSTRRDVQEAMTSQPKGTVVAVPDAGRVLYRKEAMVGEQRSLEKDFFDVRNRNYLFLLGFQDWKQLPDFLASRRATHCFYIPRRGTLWGYSRSTLDERVGDGRGLHAWPDADLVDRYPSLEGSDLWDKYTEFDEQEKLDRMGSDESEVDPDSIQKREHARIALRLTKPWNDDDGMSQREASKYVDYSRTWVSERSRLWKEGELEFQLDTNA